MKKLLTALSLTAMLALTGCGVKDVETGGSTHMHVRVIETPDGKRVTCVAYNANGYVGGVSCDWDGAK